MNSVRPSGFRILDFRPSRALKNIWNRCCAAAILAAALVGGAASHVHAAPMLSQDKPADVTIQLVTEDYVPPTGAIGYVLQPNAKMFLDTEGRGYTEKDFAFMVRIPTNVTGTYCIVIRLKDERLPFEQVSKILDKLRRLAEPNSKVVILVYYNPPDK